MPNSVVKTLTVNGTTYDLKDVDSESYAPKASPALTGTPTAPTASSGTNSTQIATTAFVQGAVSSAIGNVNSFEVSVVQSLPTTNIDPHTIYFISNSGSAGNIYDEYMYINNNWEKIGTTDVDLSGYLAKTNTTAFIPTGDYNPATKKYVDDSKSLMTVVIQAHAENGVTTYFANKTYEELFSHIENNDGDAICLYMTNVYRLLSCNNGVISFHNVCVFDDEGDGIVEGQFITIDYNDVVTLSNRFGYFIANPSTVTPSPAGVASIGSNYTFALADHVHPTDTTRAAVNDVLTKTNAISYTPTSDYHPATKKYVDDAIGSTSCATISEIEEMCNALGFQSVTIDTSDYVDDDN